MNHNILQNLGENYEYTKTIISNKIEIKKLEAIDEVSSIAGTAVASLIIAFFGFFIFTFLIIALTIFIAHNIGSFLYGLLIMSGILALVCIIIFATRKVFIFPFVANKILGSLVENDEDEQ